MADTTQSGPSTWLSTKLSAFLDGSDSMKSPDVTKVQALALAQAFIAILVVLGVNLDDNVQQAIIALSVVLGAVLPLSDAAIRRKRIENADVLADARAKVRAQAPAGVGGGAARVQLAQAELKLAEARRKAAG